jgi:tetratricopeptide (TPR) repeat protein
MGSAMSVASLRDIKGRARGWFTWPALTIFVVALTVRVIHLWEIRGAPFFTVLIGDSRAYDDWAQRIARGDWLGHEVFYQAPLYPYFLGAIYAAAGHDLSIVRVCQAIIGSLSCVLLGSAGWRLFSKPAGIVAGLALALYAPAIFFDGLLQKSVLDVFFICLAIWILSGILVEPQRRRQWLWLGLTMGGLSLTRENALVFVAVILLWAFARRRVPGSERVATAGLFLLGLTVVLLPVAVRNNAVGGGLYVTTSQFGPNLYIGNNERADGTYMSLRFGRGAPEYERQDATELAEQAMGRRLTPGEVSSYWTRRALAFITSQPAAWLRLLGRKTALLWNAREMLDTESQETHAEWSRPLRLAGYIGHFGVLVPLAVFGVWATWPQHARLWVLYGLTIAYAGSVVLFYVFARYRYPLVPFLVLFAAAGLTGMRHFFHANPLPVVIGAVTTVAAMTLFANWPLLSSELMRAISENNVGTALHEQGRLDEAAAHYRRAIDIRPDYAPAHNNLGVVLRAQGQVQGAIDRYEEALRLYEDYPSARLNLSTALRARGNDLASGGELPDAIADLQRAVMLRSEDPAARYDLATVLLEANRYAEAIDQLRIVFELTPRRVEAHNNLGIALASQGKLDDAIVHFQQALRLQPGFDDARRNLATALAARRQFSTIR